MLAAIQLDIDEAERMHAELVRLARARVHDRLGLGLVLHRLDRRFVELGFRTLAGYTRERVSQSARWCADSRALARRLEERPAIRAALVSGRIGWSKAELLARHSTPEDEAELLDAARGASMRALRRGLRDESADQASEADGFSTIDLALTKTELLALEATRRGIEHVTGGPIETGHWLECAVFEGMSTLLGQRPELARFFDWPAEPPARPDDVVEPPAPRLDAPELAEAFEEPTGTDDPVALDRMVVEYGARLSSRDLWLGELLSTFLRGRGWRALGFASEQQYFDEGLSMARSTARGRVTLARRARWLEELGDAVREQRVGYEQAQLVARVASPDTLPAWIARAERRTFKHLREEVQAAELLARVAGEGPRGLSPPTEEELEAVMDFERGVLSGETMARAVRRGGEGDEVQMSVNEPRRHRLGVRARDEVIEDFGRLEAAHAASGLPGSFVTFLCVAFWDAWGERFFVGNRWKALHDRDRHRCVSPVCESRNVTNHHIVYRSHGGGDELENQTSICEFCHLEGEHGGRLRIRGTASRLRWWLGRVPVMEIDGREVVRR